METYACINRSPGCPVPRANTAYFGLNSRWLLKFGQQVTGSCPFHTAQWTMKSDAMKKKNRAALKEDPENSNNYHMKMSIIIS